LIDKNNSVLVEQHTVGQRTVRIFIDRTSGKFWTSGTREPLVYTSLLQLRREVQWLATKAAARAEALAKAHTRIQDSADVADVLGALADFERATKEAN